MRPDYRRSDTAEALILIWEIRKTWHCAHQILLIIQMLWSPRIYKNVAKWKEKWICLEVTVWQHWPTLPRHSYKICLKVSVRAFDAVICISLRGRYLLVVLLISLRQFTCNLLFKSYQTILVSCSEAWQKKYVSSSGTKSGTKKKNCTCTEKS